MFRRSPQHRLPQLRSIAALVSVLALFGSACSSSARNAGRVVPVSPEHVEAPAPPVVLTAPPQDPVVTLIDLSDGHFKAGQRELELGHVEAARHEFDKALALLMESPYGGRTEPRIREHFDRLVDRISAYEIKALAEGDGFTEKKYEPASIDELLAVSATFAEPVATPELEETVDRGSATRWRPTSRFPRTRRSCPTSRCSRGGCASSSRKG